MNLPCVLSAFSNSDIEKRRSRETTGRLRYQFVKRSRRLDGPIVEDLEGRDLDGYQHTS